jgi:SpoVK/Ycf46/Vps4 family AAA+-type ATPase
MYLFSENARVMVLAATNRPSELDEAILRRFTQIFEIGIPVESERSKILQVVLKGENVEHNIDYDHIASLCEGFTGSDILELCKQAAFYPIRELLDDEKKGRKLDVSILTSVPTLELYRIACCYLKIQLMARLELIVGLPARTNRPH